MKIANDVGLHVRLCPPVAMGHLQSRCSPTLPEGGPPAGRHELSTVCIIVRNFYHAIELCQVWKGYLITHEVYFDVLDGMLMVLAVVVFNFAHPAWCLQEPTRNDLAVEEVTEEKAGRRRTLRGRCHRSASS